LQLCSSKRYRPKKRGIGKEILGGMLANMCVEFHLRELVEQGFQVAVVKEATAAPEASRMGYGYTAALINCAYIAHAVLTTEQVVEAIFQYFSLLACDF
jgi:nicotinamidase-related amidase